MLNLPSLPKIIERLGSTFQRFPFVLLSAMLLSITSVILIENGSSDKYTMQTLSKIIMCSVLGISLFLSIDLYCERKKLPKSTEVLFDSFGFLLLLVYYFLLPLDLNVTDMIRYTLWSVAVHLLVSFIPYILIEKTEVNGFWQYNQILFLNILTSALYTGVLFFGISIAILASDQLFELEIDGKIYSKLWVLLVGIFNTWFFLSKAPNVEEIESLDQSENYPFPLKVFTQYVLLPLVSLYLLILYLYGFKILLEWNLPKGWVTYLVIAFSTAGIFSLLLIYPMRDKAENAWIKTFSRWFYLALIPLVFLLLIAIGRRIYDYGITEPRYFIIILAFWLLGMSLYFLVSRQKNIQVIPISLFLLAIFTSFGPWGAFYVSRTSQISRLEAALEENGLLVNGKVQAKDTIFPESVHNNINSIISFVMDRDDISSLRPYFNQDLDSLTELSLNKYDKEAQIKKLIFGSQWGSNPYEIITAEQGIQDFTFDNNEIDELSEISGYNYMIPINEFGDNREERVKFFDIGRGKSLKIVYNFKEAIIEVFHQNNRIVGIALNPLMEKLVQQNTSSNSLRASSLTMLDKSKSGESKLLIHSIHIQRLDKAKNKLAHIKGVLFVRINEEEEKK